MVGFLCGDPAGYVTGQTISVDGGLTARSLRITPSEGGLPGGANHRADMQGVEGKRVAALIGDGFEEIELAEPRRALEEAGAIVTIVGIDERARQRIRGKRGLDDGQSLRAEELVADCTAEDFDALLIPGGTSPDRIRTDREVQRFVREFDTLKKPTFSIGHGAQVLISSQIVAWTSDYRRPVD